MRNRVLIRRVGALTCATLAACAVANFCGTTHAALLWYDGFDTPPYTTGAPLVGQSGGSGTFFSGAWIDAGSANTVLSTSLTRPGQLLPSSGGSVGDNDCCARSSRLLDSPWGGFTDPDGTFYVGYLMNFGTGIASDPHHRVFEMHDGGFSDGLNRNLMLGVSNFALGGNLLTLYVRDSVDDTQPTVVLSENADLDDLNFQGTHHLVLKFEMSTTGNDVISAFLDPVGNVEPAMPSASISVGQFLADRMSGIVNFVFNTGAPSDAVFDEIRVGTQFADVGNNTLAYASVPEPATLSLLALAIAGCGLTVRRSRV
jgi:hypothetical protein